MGQILKGGIIYEHFINTTSHTFLKSEIFFFNQIMNQKKKIAILSHNDRERLPTKILLILEIHISVFNNYGLCEDK